MCQIPYRIGNAMKITDIETRTLKGSDMDRPVYPAWAPGTSKPSQDGVAELRTALHR